MRLDSAKEVLDFGEKPNGGTYNHIVTWFEVLNKDGEKATKIKFRSGYETWIDTPYPFRTQGNIHIVFGSETNEHPFNIVSFDGHEGRVYADRNETIGELGNVLNSFLEDEIVDKARFGGEVEIVEEAIASILKFII